MSGDAVARNAIKGQLERGPTVGRLVAKEERVLADRAPDT